MRPVAREAAPGDLDAAVAALTEAFQRDDFAAWVVPDAAARRRGMRELFSGLLPEMLGKGAVLDVTEDGQAAALWYPPTIRPSFEAPPAARPEVAEAFAALGRTLPAGTYWYLDFVGAAAGGQGHGGALLAHRLARLDAEATASALWTGAERNLRFYERHGYDVREALDFGGARAWWLWRDPA